MQYEQWEKILNEVNNEKDLSKDNVIDKIKQKLGEEDIGEYNKWNNNSFDVNYLFHTVLKLDAEYKCQCTLLHLAAHGNLKNLAGALLNVKGINVNAKIDIGKRKGMIPLHLAFMRGIEIETLLIEHGADINAEIDIGDTKGVTFLHEAVKRGNIERTKILIENGAEVNAMLYEGEMKEGTPLHFAAESNTEAVKILIENGANPLLKDEEGRTPRDLAKDDGIKEFLKVAEEKQLKKLNEEKNKLPQDKDDNKDTTPLPEGTEKKQPTSAAKKGVFAGGVVAALGTAATVALFATGTVAVELTPVVIAIAAIAVAALAVGGITYMILKPNTKMDEVEKQRLLKENVQKDSYKSCY